jgi:hypothetical protein
MLDDLLSETKRTNIELSYRCYLHDAEYYENMLKQEKRFVRYQLTSMGRSRDIERLETKAEDDLNFREIHESESLKY